MLHHWGLLTNIRHHSYLQVKQIQPEKNDHSGDDHNNDRNTTQCHTSTNLTFIDSAPSGLTPLQHGLVFLIAAIILVSHRFDAMSNPQFWAEDGMKWYAEAYNLGIFPAFQITDAGYHQIISRLTGAIAQFLPLAIVPLVFNLVALTCQTLPINLWLSARFNRFIPHRRTRALLTLPYLALPNAWETHTNLTNAHWYLAMLALMVVWAQPSPRRSWQIFDLGVVSLCAVSGPFCVFMTPLLFISCWLRQHFWRWLLWGILALGAGLQGVSIVTQTSTRSAMELAASPVLLAKILSGQVFLGALIGQRGYGQFYTWYTHLTSPAVLGLIWAIVILGFWLSFRGWWYAAIEWKLFCCYAAIALFAALKSPQVSATEPQWLLLVLPGAGNRYWLYPMLAFLGCLCVLALRPLRHTVKISNSQINPQANPKISQLSAEKLQQFIFHKLLFGKFKLFALIPQKPLKFIPKIEQLIARLLLGLMCVGISLDWQHRPFENYQFPSYAQQVMQAPIGSTITIPNNPPGWQFSLIKRDRIYWQTRPQPTRKSKES